MMKIKYSLALLVLILISASVEAAPAESSSVSTTSSNPGLERFLFVKIFQINPSEDKVSIAGNVVSNGGTTAKGFSFRTANQLGKTCVQLVQTAFLYQGKFNLDIAQADSAGNLSKCTLTVSN